VAILDAPRRGCFNIHASLLPRWRGAAPIQRAILAGDAETGVTIMRMERGLDTGPALLREATPVDGKTAGELTGELAAMGARLMVEALGRLEALPQVPQPEEGVTYAAKIDKAEARIDWNEPADAVLRRVRAMNPAPGAWCMAGELRLKVHAVEAADGAGAPGAMLGDGVVACGDGAVRLVRVQPAGSRAMEWAEFARARTPTALA
jgi:methionyl-tRNA formyltransferase